MSSPLDGAPEQGRRRPAKRAIALVRSVVVAVAHESVERPLQGRAAGEVAVAEGRASVFLENRALQALDEAIGPGMARFGPGVPDRELATGLIERAPELGSAIG
jgi:hypothetical protein